jgi:AcrR family transcriptional regulator
MAELLRKIRIVSSIDTVGILWKVTTPVRRRRRGKDLDHALLEAAWAELAAVGYANLTMDGVAARAGTSKPVIYRRWPSRPELVLAAVRHQGPVLSGEPPDSGSLRGDVLALLERISGRLQSLGQEVLLGLLADYVREPELMAYVQPQVLTIGLAVMTTILQRAAARGEVDPAAISPRVASLPVDLLRHELLVTRQAVPQPVIIEIVDGIFLPLLRCLSNGGPGVTQTSASPHLSTTTPVRPAEPSAPARDEPRRR